MTKRFSTLAALLTLTTFSALMGADGDDGCGPPIVENNGFDLWCGNQLCNWEVEAGNVDRVPTWHEADFGAGFRGPLVAVSQLTNLDSFDECLRFRSVANIELSAIVTVEIDFFDDGIYDVERNIPTSDWARIEFELAAPDRYRNARIRIRKEGNGEAVLAEMQVNRSDKCTLPPVVISDQPLGAGCAEDAQCASGSCNGFDPDDGTICNASE